MSETRYWCHILHIMGDNLLLCVYLMCTFFSRVVYIKNNMKKEIARVLMLVIQEMHFAWKNQINSSLQLTKDDPNLTRIYAVLYCAVEILKIRYSFKIRVCDQSARSGAVVNCLQTIIIKVSIFCTSESSVSIMYFCTVLSGTVAVSAFFSAQLSGILG